MSRLKETANNTWYCVSPSVRLRSSFRARPPLQNGEAHCLTPDARRIDSCTLRQNALETIYIKFFKL
jgi:hypothetical protein